jgi:hypothetical protein
MPQLQNEIADAVARLPEHKKRQVLDFARKLIGPPADHRERLRSLAGSIASEDGEVMLQAINEGCETIDAGSW